MRSGELVARLAGLVRVFVNTARSICVTAVAGLSGLPPEGPLAPTRGSEDGPATTGAQRWYAGHAILSVKVVSEVGWPRHRYGSDGAVVLR